MTGKKSASLMIGMSLVAGLEARQKKGAYESCFSAIRLAPYQARDA